MQRYKLISQNIFKFLKEKEENENGAYKILSLFLMPILKSREQFQANLLVLEHISHFDIGETHL